MPAFLQVPIREATIAAQYAEASLPQKSREQFPFFLILAFVIDVNALAPDMYASSSSGLTLNLLLRPLNYRIQNQLC